MPASSRDAAYRTKPCKHFAGGAGKCSKEQACVFSHINERTGVDHHKLNEDIEQDLQQDDEREEMMRLLRKYGQEPPEGGHSEEENPEDSEGEICQYKWTLG